MLGWAHPFMHTSRTSTRFPWSLRASANPGKLVNGVMADTACATKLARTERQLECKARSEHPFRVLTFNMLADGLAQDGDFIRVSNE